MDTIDQINKIQETLRELNNQLEVLKDTLSGDTPPAFSKDSMRVKDHLKSIVDFGKRQDSR